MNSNLARIEALIYVTGETGISIDQIQKQLNLSLEEVTTLLKQLTFKYQSDDESGLQVINFDQRYQITTKPELNPDLKRLYSDDNHRILTQASLEGLTIIAYNQPITRVEVDDIRGVNSSAIIQKLFKQGLITTAGKSNVAGNPRLYKTTDLFLNLFGLNSLDDLPPMDLDNDLKGE
ncbi:SMC-Scp complex subunit ScpB [Nicoliella spurrieriana]|uniref:Segregation and condensation protein B n=1 Tax=Nicoliella spurrieriana TaxID=2925830 RepID=A0A976RRM0_9LACO|nr:SMC-Scp complex subunit ScpB [Nicoliella spurrieriana]UQS86557.1 SMC-Scp complex subunit ScpB [Nicoliella spurrieriana]